LDQIGGTLVTQAEPVATLDRDWARAARWWGTFAAVAFVIATIVYLLDAFDLLATPPSYAPSPAGQLEDEATFYAALFSYRNLVWWSQVLRDVLYFFAYLGLIPVLLAANAAVRTQRATIQVAGGFIGVGVIFGALNAVTFLALTDWWKGTGWQTVPSEIMVAVGRTAEFVDGISTWFGTASQAALAIGFAYLGAAARTDVALPRRLTPIAFAGAAVLAAMVVIRLLPVDTGPLWDILAFAVGVVIGPAFAWILGRHLGALPPAQVDVPA